MSALTWAALGGAALLAPTVSVPARRAGALALRGRLGSPDRGGPAQCPSRSGLAGAVAVLAASATVAALWVAAGWVLGAAAAVAVVTGGWLGSRASRRRAQLRERDQLAAAVTLIAAELDAGASPAAALDAAADLAPAEAERLRAAARRARAGDDPDLAGDLAALGHAWRLAASAGVPLAQVCRRVAADLASAREQHRAVMSALAGARSSAGLLAGLPVLGLALGTAMQADPLEVLATTPSGQMVCLVGVGLDAAGLVWTHWLTARAEGP